MAFVPLIIDSNNDCVYIKLMDFPGGSVVNNLRAIQESRDLSLGWKDLLEKGMVTHCSILAWRIPWTGESDGL